MVPIERRPSAYGIFTGIYGIAWFVGSVVIGRLYDVSPAAVVGFSVAAQVIAIPIFMTVGSGLKRSNSG
jgi:predicted MFS family arabinose efflux permease